MLCLGLYKEDNILIGGLCKVKLIEVRHNYCRLGFTADRTICVDREGSREKRNAEIASEIRLQCPDLNDYEIADVVEWIWSAIDFAAAETREFEASLAVRKLAAKYESFDVGVAGVHYEVSKSGSDPILMEK